MYTNGILSEVIANYIDLNLENNISITVIYQEVTLTGTVNSYDEKDKIEEIAWNVFGVVSVNNELTIYNEN